jgi:hypothetical protein
MSCSCKSRSSVTSRQSTRRAAAPSYSTCCVAAASTRRIELSGRTTRYSTGEMASLRGGASATAAAIASRSSGCKSESNSRPTTSFGAENPSTSSIVMFTQRTTPSRWMTTPIGSRSRSSRNSWREARSASRLSSSTICCLATPWKTSPTWRSARTPRTRRMPTVCDAGTTRTRWPFIPVKLCSSISQGGRPRKRGSSAALALQMRKNASDGL